MNRHLKSFIIQILSLISHDDSPKIIYYHDIGVKYTSTGTDCELLKAHVNMARSCGYDFVRGDKFFESNTAKKMLICFDDGFRGIYDEREYFIRENLFPTVFIAVELVGRKGYLTWDEIRKLQEVGFVFESHTWSHRSLTTVPSAELRHELMDSKKMLEQQLGCEVNQLCFPRGLFSPRVMDACEKSGYRDLFTSMPKTTGIGFLSLTKSVNPLLIRLVPRILAQSASSREFKCLLRGSMSIFARHYLNMHFIKDDR